MASSREHQARRRALLQRRRTIAAGVSVTLLAAFAIGVPSLNRSHTVTVVHAAVQRHETTTASAVGIPAEYTATSKAAPPKSPPAMLDRGPATNANAAASAPDSLLATDAARSFERLASSLPGHIELAVIPLGAGRREVLGGDMPEHGWSTTKVPVLVSLLRARGAGGLTAQEREWAQAAITQSDNQSVLDLFAHLERLKGGLGGASEYMERVLRISGDNETTVATAPPPPGAVTTFGQTEWSPGEAVKFFRALALGCLLPADQTSYVLSLMESIEPSESWGLGSAGFSSVAFKGGWGPEGGGYLVRQSGIVDPGSARGAAIAIVASAPSFPVGTELLTRTASWLRHHLALSSRASTGCAPD
jgi:hypothetical protein